MLLRATAGHLALSRSRARRKTAMAPDAWAATWATRRKIGPAPSQ